jgi:hypothetical protein
MKFFGQRRGDAGNVAHRLAVTFYEIREPLDGGPTLFAVGFAVFASSGDRLPFLDHVAKVYGFDGRAGLDLVNTFNQAGGSALALGFLDQGVELGFGGGP